MPKPKLYNPRHPERTLLYQTIAEHFETWHELASAGQSVRQWVLSVPKRLRYFMQRDGVVLNMVLRIFLRVSAQALQSHSQGAQTVDKAALQLGAVALAKPQVHIHRFGSSLNGHVHFHVCVVDGVFEEVPGEGDSDVHASPPRTHRHRYFGVLAPNSPHRAAVTALATLAAPAKQAVVQTEPASTGAGVPAVVPLGHASPPTPEPAPPRRAPAHYLWAVLIARIYEVFPLLCRCAVGKCA